MSTTDPRQTGLLELQKQYRNMELNRRAYAEESQVVLRKQQSTIDKLRKDNEALKTDISMVMRSSNRPLTVVQQENLQRLHEQAEKYSRCTNEEKQSYEVTGEQINIMKQKILQQRKSMGGVNASKENQFMIQKQIRILENRLDKALVKFNEAISNNKILRDTIDDLRRERVVFENIYRKMERELQERKQKMAEIIEISNQSYEQRDTYQMEIAAIEQANRKEQDEFEEQMVELGRMLETDLALPSFGRATTSQSSRHGHGESKFDGEGGEHVGGKLSKSTSWPSSSGGGGSTLAVPDSLTLERVQNFEEAFNRIRAATGITDIDELVKTFIKNEDHNFSLFNYVNEQNNEIEKYEEQIQALREEERKFAQESGDDVHQHKQILRELGAKLQSTESMAEKYEMRCQDLQRTIESLKRGISAILERLDEEEDDFREISTVTESNMAHLLSLIEQQANRLLERYSETRLYLMRLPSVVGAGSTPSANAAPATSAPSSSQPSSSSSTIGGPPSPTPGASLAASTLVTVLGTGPKVAMGQEQLRVNPPKLDDYQSDEEEDEEEDETRPLTREELKARTLNRLQRRGQSSSKGNGKKKGGKMGLTR